MNSLLPPHDGYLPYFLFYGCVSALIHTLATYLKPHSSLLQFSGPSAPAPSTLLAHVYGIKNTYTALIRLYAAYHIDNRELYALAMWTFAGVLLLYVPEMLVWKTVRAKEGWVPLAIAGIGLGWMIRWREYYLG